MKMPSIQMVESLPKAEWSVIWMVIWIPDNIVSVIWMYVIHILTVFEYLLGNNSFYRASFIAIHKIRMPLIFSPRATGDKYVHAYHIFWLALMTGSFKVCFK